MLIRKKQRTASYVYDALLLTRKLEERVFYSLFNRRMGIDKLKVNFL